MKGWSPALRIAARDALAHKVRSALVLLLISLPVLVVTATLVVVMTARLDATEQIERRMGTADAVVWTDGAESVTQNPDPFMRDAVSWTSSGPRGPGEPEVMGVLGEDVRLLPMQESRVDLRHTDDTVISIFVTEVDLSDPLAAGLFELTDGHLPRGPHEIVVNDALQERGYGLGDTLKAPGVSEPATVVGVGRDADRRRNEKALGPIGSLVAQDPRSRFDAGDRQQWLVEGGPVTWSQVQELNSVGFVVGSRAVMTDPPLPSELPDNEYDNSGNGQAEFIAVAVMVAAMALLEVVLLAGPAFAVTARSHARTLALITAAGGTPAQARRVILAGGIVLGALATVLGVLLGIASAWLLMPLAQGVQDTWFGPFDVPGLWVAVVAACGLLSAFGAAFVPAWIASRQDPVAVLAGRRADPAPSPRQPVFGLVLLGLGVAGAALGATRYGNQGPVLLTASALVAVIGMIFVVPLVVTWTARWARSLPLPVRYAARDAARHRTRTVPAVAAVAATVAGVIALGIGVSSDEEQHRHTYEPQLAMGEGEVRWWGDQVLPGEKARDEEEVWGSLLTTATRVLPGVEVAPLRVLTDTYTNTTATYWSLALPGVDADEDEYFPGFVTFGDSGSSGILVADDARSAQVSATVQEQAEAALAAGKVVVFSDTDTANDRVELTLTVETYDSSGDMAGSPTKTRTTLPAAFITVGSPPRGAAIMPTAMAEESDFGVTTSALSLRGNLDEANEKKLTESLAAVSVDAEVYVERGYQRDPWTTVVVWALGLGGGLLMVVGTLTATFLAVSDARPDLATLSAVGASPRTRRGVAGAYALTIGSIGAVLGALVGFVPGIAVSRPLTSSPWSESDPGPFLDIPWLLIGGVVLVLPLATAAVVWLSARSRLPMVARID